VDVEEAHVGKLAPSRFDRRAGISNLGTDLETVSLERQAHAGSRGWMVVRNEDARHLTHGTITSIRVP
jgi:hypothetical protein